VAKRAVADDPGMDHDHYAFRAAPDAPAIRWPGGAHVAFFVLLHLEAWEITPPGDAHRDPDGDGDRHADADEN